jgi:hypothetical protein
LWRSTQVFGRLFTPIHKAGSTKTEAISKKLSFLIRPPGSNFPFHAASLLLIHHRHKKKSRFPRSWRGFWVETAGSFPVDAAAARAGTTFVDFVPCVTLDHQMNLTLLLAPCTLYLSHTPIPKGD